MPQKKIPQHSTAGWTLVILKVTFWSLRIVLLKCVRRDKYVHGDHKFDMRTQALDDVCVCTSIQIDADIFYSCILLFFQHVV